MFPFRANQSWSLQDWAEWSWLRWLCNLKTQHSVDANMGSLQREAGKVSHQEQRTVLGWQRGLEAPECAVQQDSWFSRGSNGNWGSVGLRLG